MIFSFKSKGFTLVELMVSLAITSILLLGLSVFFSSTLKQLFLDQQLVSQRQQQFLAQEVIRQKFSGLEEVVSLENDQLNLPWLLVRNDSQALGLPFTLMGIRNDRMVLKDFVFFKKMMLNPANATEHIYADSGRGTIRVVGASNITSNNLTSPGVPNYKNMTSFVFEPSSQIYYITFANQNKVLKCPCSGNSCPRQDCIDISSQLGVLDHPTDIVLKDRTFFISNSGLNEIIEFDTLADLRVSWPKLDLNFPTGLELISEAFSDHLLVADTGNHRVVKIDVRDPAKAMEVIMGNGFDSNCHQSTALFCGLNWPTGLFLKKNNAPQPPELYVSDSGNNRILRAQDPGVPTTIQFQVNASKAYLLDYIEIENPNWDGSGEYDEANSNLIGSKVNFSNKVFKNDQDLTVYSNASCLTTNQYFHVNENPRLLGIGIGDRLIVRNANLEKSFTVQSITEDVFCDSSPEGDIKRNRIEVSSSPIGLNTSDKVYFSNPPQINFIIKNMNLTPSVSGYETFNLKIYEQGETQPDVFPLVVRIGNQKLGTLEDEVVTLLQKDDDGSGIPFNSNLNFPTGLTNVYFLNVGEGKIRQINDSNFQENYSLLDYESLGDFDFVSHFDANQLKFNKINNNKLLQMTFDVPQPDATIKTFTLNAALP